MERPASEVAGPFVSLSPLGASCRVNEPPAEASHPSLSHPSLSLLSFCLLSAAAGEQQDNILEAFKRS